MEIKQSFFFIVPLLVQFRIASWWRRSRRRRRWRKRRNDEAGLTGPPYRRGGPQGHLTLCHPTVIRFPSRACLWHNSRVTCEALHWCSILTLLPTGVFAQNPPPPPQDPQKPPAAVGEEGEKPTRNFTSALVHNLGDDVKHLPRKNSFYWLAGGGAAALAVHPADDNINRHFEGTGPADKFWKPGR